jgi:hypothetical protein
MSVPGGGPELKAGRQNDAFDRDRTSAQSSSRTNCNLFCVLRGYAFQFTRRIVHTEAYRATQFIALSR